jgi:hypothetical protein
LLGSFADVTATQLPALVDASFDVEFVDFDGDGDYDLHSSNQSSIQNQSNHWLTNAGGLQAGTTGFYVLQDERWVGLGAPGSSVPISAVLGSGGFIDWTGDSDFADLDDDGDLDLFHSSFGGSFGGQVPSRIFLNDGLGFYTEFNPSGFQLITVNIANGNPAIWAEGVQAGGTSNTGGLQADIATVSLDMDLGDIDGDFDFDLVLGSRNDAPRAFTNRLAETASLSLRDRTVAIFPLGYWSGSDNYEQELGDMDRDGDLDLLGVNYPGFDEATYANSGAGTWGDMTPFAGSANDDNEADFVDYDNDGELDVFIAAFIGPNRLYRNDAVGTGSGEWSYTLLTAAESGLIPSERSLDVDAADLDKDGDYDAMTGEDSNQNENYYINATQVADAHAPYIPNVEALGDAVASAAPRSVRAQVYDNAPYYLTWYNPTVTTLSVEGIALPELDSMSSQGQLFRSVLPGNLYGAVQYGFRSSDEHGNTGVSADHGFTSSHAAFSSSFGTGSAGSIGTPIAKPLSVPFGGTTLWVAGTGMPSGTLTWLGVTDTAIPTLSLPGLCNVNVAGNVLHFSSGLTDASGSRAVGLPIPTGFAGAEIHAQCFALDGTGGNLLSSSAGLSITLQ